MSSLSLAISAPATYLLRLTLLFKFRLIFPHRVCSTQVTSHHASVGHMMHQDASANQKKPRHSNRHDGWMWRWEYTIVSWRFSGLYDFYENIKEWDLKVNNWMINYESCFRSKDIPSIVSEAFLFVFQSNVKMLFGPSGVLLQLPQVATGTE